jgi:hypothetical protein
MQVASPGDYQSRTSAAVISTNSRGKSTAELALISWWFLLNVGIFKNILGKIQIIIIIIYTSNPSYWLIIFSESLRLVGLFRFKFHL